MIVEDFQSAPLAHAVFRPDCENICRNTGACPSCGNALNLVPLATWLNRENPGREGGETVRAVKNEITAGDLFCGGGTSEGLLMAATELEANLMLIAVNHWSVAIDTHRTNHPTLTAFSHMDR